MPCRPHYANLCWWFGLTHEWTGWFPRFVNHSFYRGWVELRFCIRCARADARLGR